VNEKNIPQLTREMFIVDRTGSIVNTLRLIYALGDVLAKTTGYLSSWIAQYKLVGTQIKYRN
jgi:hypothetical protein